MDSLTGRRVLVLEDEYFVATDIADALRRSGATVLGPFSDSRVALARLDGDAAVDIAILDIDLHGNADFGVADALLERGIPFVFASGYGRRSIPERYAAVPLWEKPFDPDMLASTLGTGPRQL
jgi:CheY-like chemotaxis protein